MSAFTNDELSWLHTILEGHAEVAADNGDDAEADRLLEMVCDDPMISPADAEWIAEDLRAFEDEPAAVTLRRKLALIVAASTSPPSGRVMEYVIDGEVRLYTAHAATLGVDPSQWPERIETTLGDAVFSHLEQHGACYTRDGVKFIVWSD